MHFSGALDRAQDRIKDSLGSSYANYFGKTPFALKGRYVNAEKSCTGSGHSALLALLKPLQQNHEKIGHTLRVYGF